jgi:hypothetical protein
MYLEVCWKAKSGSSRRTIARRSPTVLRRCATHARMARPRSCRTGDLDQRPAGGRRSPTRGRAGSGSRKGCLDTPLREGSGTRGTPGALPLSPRSPVRAAYSAPTGLRDGAARGGEGAPLRGHQQAIVTPVPAQILWREGPNQTRRCHASLIRSTRSDPSIKHDVRLRSGDSHPRGQGSTSFLGSGAHTSGSSAILPWRSAKEPQSAASGSVDVRFMGCALSNGVRHSFLSVTSSPHAAADAGFAGVGSTRSVFTKEAGRGRHGSASAEPDFGRRWSVPGSNR